ncbi:MAG: ATP-binding protein [Myxococcota bacterium]
MRTSLSARVFLGFVVILALFAGTTGFGLVRMHRIRESLRYTADTYVALTRNLAQIKTLLDIRDDYTERALAEADPRLRLYLVRYARDFYPRAIRARLGEARSSVDEATELSTTDAQRRFLADAGDRLRTMDEDEVAAEEALAELFDRTDLGDEERLLLRERARERAAAVAKQVRLLSLNLDERIAQSVLKAERDEQDAAWALITLATLAGAVGLLVTLWVARALRPLRQLADAAHALSRGSYTVEIDPNAGAEMEAVALELRALGNALKEREGALARGNEELTRLKAFLESVLASARVAIVVTDGSLKVRRVNPAARSFLQLGILETEGRPLEELPIWSALKDHEKELRRAAAGGEGIHLSTVPLVRADGSEVVLDVDVEPLRDPRSATPVTGVVVLGTDVTDREAARERLTATERLAAVAHLAAQVAHEIRNPLSSLGLNCELLEDELGAVEGPRAEEIKNLLRAIGREIDRLAELTEGYLKHARLGRGQPRSVDINAAVEDLAALVRDDLRRRGVTLTVIASPMAGTVRADPSRLRQALLNLVRNASEAVTGHSNAVVRVMTSRQGGKVSLVVEDNGPGVNAELKERIFEPFFTTKDQGSGLGLSISRQAVEEHGGSLTYEDLQGGGARFVATFNAADGPDDDDEVATRANEVTGHAGGPA